MAQNDSKITLFFLALIFIMYASWVWLWHRYIKDKAVAYTLTCIPTQSTRHPPTFQSKRLKKNPAYLGEYLSSIFEIYAEIHHLVLQEVNNIDMWIVHGYAWNSGEIRQPLSGRRFCVLHAGSTDSPPLSSPPPPCDVWTLSVWFVIICGSDLW